MEESDVQLDDPEFQQWLIEKAKKTDPMIMLEDRYFVSRLLQSMAYGRAKRFNQREKEGGRNSALFLLKREFAEYKNKGGSNG